LGGLFILKGWNQSAQRWRDLVAATLGSIVIIGFYPFHRRQGTAEIG
jgi:hypothetical protein